MSDELTMNHAFQRLEVINDQLRNVLKQWEDLSDRERYAYVREAQENLANVMTPAANWRTMAYLNGVAIVPGQLLLGLHQRLRRWWKRRQ